MSGLECAASVPVRQKSFETIFLAQTFARPAENRFLLSTGTLATHAISYGGTVILGPNRLTFHLLYIKPKLLLKLTAGPTHLIYVNKETGHKQLASITSEDGCGKISLSGSNSQESIVNLSHRLNLRIISSFKKVTYQCGFDRLRSN